MKSPQIFQLPFPRCLNLGGGVAKRTPIYIPAVNDIRPPVTNNNRQIIEPTQYVTTSARPALDNNRFNVINEKVLEFYFDKNKKVIYVNALGYPDSVRLELRHK